MIRRLTIAAAVIPAVFAGSVHATDTAPNPWTAVEGAAWSGAVERHDLTIFLRVLASSVGSPEFTVVMSPLTTEVKARYRGRECDFYEEITNAPFAANPYFAPIAGRIIEAKLPPEFRNNKTVGKLASLIAYMAATNDRPACVCEPMPVEEVRQLCRAQFPPARDEDQPRFDKALGNQH